LVVVSITLISRIPVSAPLGVRNISRAISESIIATASASCRKALDGEKDKNTQLAGERDNLKTKADELQKSKQALEQDVEKNRMENKKLAENSNLKSYQRVSNDLATAQIKLLTGKVAFRYENLDKAFKELIYEMDLLAKIDPQVHAGYKKQVNDFLFRAMQERMGN